MLFKNCFFLTFISLFCQTFSIVPPNVIITETVNKIDNDLLNILCTSSKENSLQNVTPFEDPVQDSLDDSLVKKTGCSYTGVGAYGGFSLPAVTYMGVPIEWLVAVRTQDNAYMDVEWGTPNEYGFLVGQENNTLSRLYLWEPYTRLSEQSTPGILSSDRYVPFYFIVTNGTLAFGKACTNEELFRRPVVLDIGQEVTLGLRSHSHRYGGKYLTDCPFTVTYLKN